MTHSTQRRVLSVLATLAALTVLAGCGDDAADTTPRADESVASAPTSSAYDGPRIPPGLYLRTISKAEVRGMGLDPADFAWGPDGTFTNGYKFTETTWGQFCGPDPEALDSCGDGTYAYASADELAVTEVCCGTWPLRWSLDGAKLTLSLPGEAQPIDALNRNGTYTRVE